VGAAAGARGGQVGPAGQPCSYSPAGIDSHDRRAEPGSTAALTVRAERTLSAPPAIRAGPPWTRQRPDVSLAQLCCSRSGNPPRNVQWLACCWTRAQKGPGSDRSRDAVA